MMRFELWRKRLFWLRSYLRYKKSVKTKKMMVVLYRELCMLPDLSAGASLGLADEFYGSI
jgi:hypothetical protein